VAGRDAAERAGRPSHADVNGGGRLALDFEALWELLQFERRAKPALDDLLARDRHPHRDADAERQHFQAEVPERPDRPHVSSALASAGFTRARRWRINDRRRARSPSTSKPRSIWPSTTTEMMPVSSDTTMAMASFSSVRPIAARCRDPSSLLRRGLIVSGRKQAAAATRSFCTMTAPSWSGDFGWKIASSRS